MDALTIDEFKNALPANLKKSVNKSLIDQMNTKLADPDMFEIYRENLLGYVHVMKQGKFKVANYIDAVKYVSFKLMGKSNIRAFTITFPDKVANWQSNNVASKDIASYITAYNKSKLVNLIYEQTLTPAWVMNQDIYQRAINEQAALMTTAKSEMVRMNAANSLLTHLKPPETQKIDLNVSTKEDSSIAALRESTMELVAMQKKAMKSGVINAEEIAKQPLSLGKKEDEIIIENPVTETIPEPVIEPEVKPTKPKNKPRLFR